jgi:5-methylcytosine-specific restriction endonuclease McrA
MIKFCKKCSKETERYFDGRCKPCTKISTAIYRFENRDKRLLYDANYREKNKEKISNYHVIYHSKNKEKISEYHSIYYAKNKVKLDKLIKNYRIANPDVIRRSSNNRRAKKLGNGGKLTKGLFDKLFTLQRGKCPSCKGSLSNVKPRSPMDHIIALANGGENVDSNIQLLCRICNSRKHTKGNVEFMQECGFLL